ncbi:MAG: glycosyltransferase [Nitrosospira sp.]
MNELRAEIGAEDGTKIGLFCGSLYPDKRLDYMVEAADQIHAALPDFRLLIMGDGPSASEMNAAAGISAVGKVRWSTQRLGKGRIFSIGGYFF